MPNNLSNLYIDNPLHVPVYHYKRSGGIVIYRFVFRVGANDEPLNLVGITHFIEHLFAEKMKHIFIEKESLLDYITNLGGKYNALTYPDYMEINVTLADKKNAALVFEALCDLFDTFILDSEVIEKERLAIKSEIRRKASSADQQLYWKIYETLYKGSGYEYYRVGSEETISKISESDILLFQKNNFNSSKMIIIIAGDISEDECKKLCSSKVEFLTKNNISNQTPATKSLSFKLPENSIYTREYSSKELHLGFAWPTVPSTDKKSAILYLIAQMLSDGLDSILYKKLRFEKGLVYSVQAYSVNFAFTGNFMIITSCSPELINEVTSIVKESIKSLSNTLIDSSALSKITKRLRGRSILSEESLDIVTQRDIPAMLYPPTLSQDERLSLFDTITSQEIQNVINEYLLEEKMFTFFVGSKEILEKSLISH